MNCERAKQIPIIEYLAGRGTKPEKINGNEYWYCSPFRDERTASFKVDARKNVWHDHGTGTGGTIIDLVQTLYGVGIAGALQLLSDNKGVIMETSAIRANTSNQPQAEGGVKIKSVKLLNNPALVKYLENRRIPFQIGRAYLSECYYSVNGRDFFALGFRNDEGGYELRNSLWQGASSPKAITSSQTGDRGTVSVFEGFFDMLSALTYFGKIKPVHSWLVLNSVALLDTALPMLSQYERVNLFLDNDTAGRKAVGIITASCQSVVDCSVKYYPQHKDFNDFLTNKPT